MSMAARLMCASDGGVMIDQATKDNFSDTGKKFVVESKPSSVLDVAEAVMPGMLRASCRKGPALSARGERPVVYAVSRNPSAVASPKLKRSSSKGKELTMKITESTVDAEMDTQEWAVKRLEVLSRLAPYRLLRHVIAKQSAPQKALGGADTVFPESEAEENVNSINTLWVACIVDDAVAKGIPYVEEQLKAIFGPFGKVDTVTVREKHEDPDSERTLHQSWSLVTFDVDGGELADLEGAIQAELMLDGEKLLVDRSKVKKEVARENTGQLGAIFASQSVKAKNVHANVDIGSFHDKASCSAMFIDISGFSKITEILFKKHGLEGVDILASTLNTYLGRIVDRLTQCGGDVIKFAGDAALVIFTVTGQADLAQQTLKATQLSLECIADLEAGEAVVEGVALTAHTGIGVGDVTGFLVGGVFNRSEYAVIGAPVFQIASAEPAAGNGETVISAEGWALIEHACEGRPTTRIEVEGCSGDNWLVTGVKEGMTLGDEALGHGGGILGEIALLSKEDANLAAGEIKTVVPGGVRNRLPDFTPTSMPCISEFRLVTMLFARLQGLDYSNGDSELKKIQTIVKLIQQTIYTHDGIFLRFSVDDKGAVVMGCYGLPPSHANDPERGVMASLDFTRQIHTRAAEFGNVKCSVGLTTGYCWLGLVGGVSRCEYTTHAPMINLAARLMCASDDQVMVDGATKDACEITNKRAKFEAKPPIKAKGFDDPVPIFVPRLVASTGLALKHWTKKGESTSHAIASHSALACI